MRLHLTFSANWNKRDRVWKNAIHFKSDVFAAIAVVAAKAPYYHLFSWRRVSHLWAQKQQQQQRERDLFISIPQKGLKIKNKVRTCSLSVFSSPQTSLTW